VELQDFLRDVVEDVREEPEARKLAMALMQGWAVGLIPDPKRLATLRRMLRKPGVCARLQPSGQCGWLRKNARLVGLLDPMPGQVILCNRRAAGHAVATFEACPGYRKGDYKGGDK